MNINIFRNFNNIHSSRRHNTDQSLFRWCLITPGFTNSCDYKFVKQVYLPQIAQADSTPPIIIIQKGVIFIQKKKNTLLSLSPFQKLLKNSATLEKVQIVEVPIYISPTVPYRFDLTHQSRNDNDQKGCSIISKNLPK